MHIDRTAFREGASAVQIETLRKDCLGCETCRGRCAELADLEAVPAAVLHSRPAG